MSLINSIFNGFNSSRLSKIEHFKAQPFPVQEAILFDMIGKAKNTEWGKRYRFDRIRDVADFQTLVPLQTYEDLKPYIDRIREGEQNILWPDTIRWFAKSSGTTDRKSTRLNSSH